MLTKSFEKRLKPSKSKRTLETARRHTFGFRCDSKMKKAVLRYCAENERQPSQLIRLSLKLLLKAKGFTI